MVIRYVSELPILDARECEELIAIHKATACLGYRPSLYASSIESLAMSSPFLLPPMLRARTKAWHSAEVCLGLELETMVEFTSLISWKAGSRIGWHNDACNDYLSQRLVSIVVYLSSQGEGFSGGDLEFQEPSLVVHPKQGHLVAFFSDSRNMHRVQEILSGERFTLTMWLTQTPEHREDDRVIRTLSSQLNQIPHSPEADVVGLISIYPHVPKEMYMEGGEDVRAKRMPSSMLGLEADLRAASISYHFRLLLGSPDKVAVYMMENFSILRSILDSSLVSGFLELG
jgi:hypothetical protein